MGLLSYFLKYLKILRENLGGKYRMMIHSKHHAAYSFGGTGIGVAGSSGVSLPRSRNRRCCVVPGLASSISTTLGNLHLYELVWVSCAFSRFYRTLRDR